MNFISFHLKCSLGFILLSFITVVSEGQKHKSISWMALDSAYKIKPVMMVQFWGTYSNNMRIDSNGDGIFEPVDDRLNMFLRRARLGFKANPYPGLKFTVVGYYDGIGYDALGAGSGAANNGNVNFGIWDAYFQWQLFQNNEKINLTGGYFRPQLGRESITSGFATTSGEKALQQSYLRKHMVGAGHGRAAGINLGGLLFQTADFFQLNYNLGLFNPVNTSSLSNTTGIKWAPLLVGRAVLSLGDPESSTYRIGYVTNYFNQRRGLSLGVGGSRQGLTDLFSLSEALSFDLLFNWNQINIDADWHLLNRKDKRQTSSNSDQILQYSYQTGHIRGSYNIRVGSKILEPVIMLMLLQGGEKSDLQADAKALGAFSGTEQFINVGFNYYLNAHRLKLIAHYTSQTGSTGRNNYSIQGPLGVPVQRGNYLLVGLNAIF